MWWVADSWAKLSWSVPVAGGAARSPVGLDHGQRLGLGPGRARIGDGQPEGRARRGDVGGRRARRRLRIAVRVGGGHRIGSVQLAATSTWLVLAGSTWNSGSSRSTASDRGPAGHRAAERRGQQRKTDGVDHAQHLERREQPDLALQWPGRPVPRPRTTATPRAARVRRPSRALLHPDQGHLGRRAGSPAIGARRRPGRRPRRSRWAWPRDPASISTGSISGHTPPQAGKSTSPAGRPGRPARAGPTLSGSGSHGVQGVGLPVK